MTPYEVGASIAREKTAGVFAPMAIGAAGGGLINYLRHKDDLFTNNARNVAAGAAVGGSIGLGAGLLGKVLGGWAPQPLAKAHLEIPQPAARLNWDAIGAKADADYQRVMEFLRNGQGQ